MLSRKCRLKVLHHRDARTLNQERHRCHHHHQNNPVRHTIKITWPLELVNTSVIIIIFIVAPRCTTIGVFIGYAIIVMIER